MQKKFIFLVMIVLVLVGGAAVTFFGRNMNRSDVFRDIEIGRFSACIKDSENSTRLTDAEFSENWLKSSRALDFTAEDVDKVIHECQKMGRVRINTVSGEPLVDTQERKELLENYHRKFLNREFSVLKEQK